MSLHRPTLVAVLAAALLASTAACRREPPARRFPLTGQVLAVSSDGRELTIRHNDIKGFMPAMVMPFKVKDRAETSGRQPGDLVAATLVVTDEESWLEGVKKTGWAAFPEAAAGSEPPTAPLLADGEPLPEATLVDQDGRAFRLSSLRGAPLLITFIYTRCPLPDFCPRMDRHFESIQRAIKAGKAPADTRLLSLSFDPDYDTPSVLKDHARLVGADAKIWTFATAPKPQLEAFAARFGLSVVREADTPVLTHNLRTAIVDRQGRLVTVLGGNEWTPEQAVGVLTDRR